MPRAITIWGTVLEARRAAVSFTASGLRHRNVPQMVMALRVAARKRVYGVAALANGITIGCAPRLASIAFWPQRGV